MSEEVTAWKPRFMVGDVVLLRSGGPAMTVFLVGHLGAADEGLYQVCWFRGSELVRDAFSEPELIRTGQRDSEALCAALEFDGITGVMERTDASDRRPG